VVEAKALSGNISKRPGLSASEKQNP